MNFLQVTQNRLTDAQNNEAGFTITEILVSIALTSILIVIIFNTVGGTLLPQLVMPSLAHASGSDMTLPQKAAATIYKDIDAFTAANPDTAPTKALMTAGGYVSNIPADVVWAFHSYGGPSNPQRCVITYISGDASTAYTADSPAAFDSLYGTGSIGQSCKTQVSGSSNYVPDWVSE